MNDPLLGPMGWAPGMPGRLLLPTRVLGALMEDTVCMACGAACAQAKSKKWVHTEEIPKAIASHDAEPVERASYLRAKAAQSVEGPLLEARAYATTMRERMQREEMKGVKWSDEARHSVILLSALEQSEIEFMQLQQKLGDCDDALTTVEQAYDRDAPKA